MTVYLVEDGRPCGHLPIASAYFPEFIQQCSFIWDTYAARLPMPNDTASVAVVDGRECSHFLLRPNMHLTPRLSPGNTVPHPEHPTTHAVIHHSTVVHTSARRHVKQHR